MITPAYTEGFHGTSLSRAQSIQATGFDCDDGVICFATPDNPELAHEFGIYRARIDEEDRYALLHVSFPLTATELWPIPQQVRIPKEQATEIVIKSLITFHVADIKLHVPRVKSVVSEKEYYTAPTNPWLSIKRV